MSAACESIPKQDGLPIASNKPTTSFDTSVWELVDADSATQWGLSSDADAKQWGFSSVTEARAVQESLLAHDDWNSWDSTYDDDDDDNSNCNNSQQSNKTENLDNNKKISTRKEEKES